MKRQIILLAALVAAVSCNSDIVGLEPPSDPASETFAPSLGVDISQMTRTAEGVYYRDVIPGTGLEATATADSVRIIYAGYLKDGKLFDSGTGVRFVLGGLIPGLRIGILGMKEGGRRKVVVPSELGYGRRSRLDADNKILIPRQSTLIFDVDLLTVYNPAPAPTTP